MGSASLISYLSPSFSPLFSYSHLLTLSLTLYSSLLTGLVSGKEISEFGFADGLFALALFVSVELGCEVVGQSGQGGLRGASARWGVGKRVSCPLSAFRLSRGLCMW